MVSGCKDTGPAQPHRIGEVVDSRASLSDTSRLARTGRLPGIVDRQAILSRRLDVVVSDRISWRKLLSLSVIAGIAVRRTGRFRSLCRAIQ